MQYIVTAGNKKSSMQMLMALIQPLLLTLCQFILERDPHKVQEVNKSDDFCSALYGWLANGAL